MTKRYMSGLLFLLLLSSSFIYGQDGYWKFDEGGSTALLFEFTDDANTLGLWHLETGPGFSVPTEEFTTDANTNLLFHMEESASADDSTSNNNNGTLSGSPSTQELGKFSSSIDFDGTDDVVNVPDDASYEPGSVDFTIEAWINPDSVIGNNSIINKWDHVNSARSYHVRIENGKLVLYLSEFGTGYESLTGVTSIPVGEWSHIAVVREGTTVRLFINGAVDAAFTYTGAVYDAPCALKLGSNYGTLNPFDGKIDEFRISNIARYTTASSLDETANNNDGSFEGGAGMVSAGKFNNALELQGTEDSFLRIPDDASYEPGSGNFTIEAWINPDSVSGNNSFINKWDHTTGDRSYHFRIENGKLVLYLSETGSGYTVFTGTKDIPVGQWTHVAAVRNGNTISLFVDSSLDVSGTYTGAVHDSSADLLIGSNYGSSFFPFNGKIDEFRISNTARYPDAGALQETPDEIANNNGFLFGAAAITTGGYTGSNCLDLPGAGNAYVQIPDSAALEPGDEDFLIEAWINPDTVSGIASLINKWDHPNNQRSFHLRIENAKLVLYLSETGSGYTSLTGTTNIVALTWTHIAVERVGNALRFKINGAAGASKIHTTSIHNGTGDWLIGSNYGTSFYPYNGKIDDLKIAVSPVPTTSVTITKNGQPSANVIVHAFDADGLSLDQSETTDSNGVTSFLAEEPVKFKVSSNGRDFWSSVINPGETTTIDIPADSIVTVSKDGTPVVGQAVQLYIDGTYAISQTSDDDGQVIFNATGNVEYTATVSGGFTFSTGQITAPAAASIDIPADSTVTVTRNSQAIANQTIYLFSENGTDLNKSIKTDSSGKAVFILEDGTKVKFRTEYNSVVFWSSVITTPSDTSIDIPVDSVVTVTQDGTALANQIVYLFDSEGNYLNKTKETDANGKASFTLSTGDYKFRTSVNSFEFWSADIAAPNNTTITVAKASVLTILQESSPVASIDVYAYNEDGTYAGFSRKTDTNGKANFNIASGNYKFRVSQNGTDYYSAVITLPSDTTLTIPSGESVPVITSQPQHLEINDAETASFSV
ncbi:MAG: LamG domain-containing protein, partial [Lentisphaeria bacterium]|nr:LamG domain-containing protein [Lentisphaeria bacterium]NQZ67267.1 LamG domain-containing protein [Lentisphaeria bacterium]